MPTLSLYVPRPNLAADAWHRVTAPGGYEWWYFDAEDETGDLQIVAIFLEGFIFHPGYLRAFNKYVNAPTKRQPPLPGQFPCAYFVVYEKGRVLSQFMSQYRPAEFRASEEKAEVRIGPNHLNGDGRGGYRLRLRGVPWQLTWRGPRRQEAHQLSADLTFRPRFQHPPDERIFLSRQLSGADHHWVIANPLCNVEGTIQIFNGGGANRSRTIAMRGRGYHDHNYGTGPIGPGLRQWIWGRILTDQAALTFHYARPDTPWLTNELHLVEATQSGNSELPVKRVSSSWDRKSALMLKYPSHLVLDDLLHLNNPRMLDSSPFYMRLTYDALVRGKKARAFCEVAYPHRLRWPILGRMIEMSIHQVK